MSTPTGKRIAMWSGPRNISTAMMYAFAQRRDCVVWDEPFYAFYLTHSGVVHPLQEAIIAAGETEWDTVAAACVGDPPGGASVHYQKHMCQHMLEGFDRSFIAKLDNAFLIRAPEKVLASYAAKRAEVTLGDIGFVQQAEIFDRVCDRLGKAPPIIDADDVLTDPQAMLQALCSSLGIGFDEAMLSWPQGRKPYDGVWASHWYQAVWQSTGFAAPRPRAVALSGEHKRIADAARPFYERLARYRLSP